MTFRQKLPKGYFQSRELKEVRRKYKGHIPFTEVAKEGQRVVAHYPKQTHRVGAIIFLNKKEYVVTKVSRKGVHLRKILKSKKGLLDDERLGKERFVREKNYIRAVPVGTFWVFAPA